MTATPTHADCAETTVATGGGRGRVSPYYTSEDGRIIVYCGDARAILPTLTYDVLVCDPPYGGMLRSGWSGAFGDCAVAGDESTELRDWAIAEAGDVPMIVFGSPRLPRPKVLCNVLVWDKGEHVGMGDLSFPWKPNHEEIYVIGSGFTGRRTGSVLRFNAIAGTVALVNGRHHPTEKPTALMQALIDKCPDGVIVDPFMGSGSTLRAAANLGRRAIGIEIKERYCSIACTRLQQQALPIGWRADG